MTPLPDIVYHAPCLHLAPASDLWSESTTADSPLRFSYAPIGWSSGPAAWLDGAEGARSSKAPTTSTLSHPRSIHRYANPGTTPSKTSLYTREIGLNHVVTPGWHAPPAFLLTGAAWHRLIRVQDYARERTRFPTGLPRYDLRVMANTLNLRLDYPPPFGCTQQWRQRVRFAWMDHSTWADHAPEELMYLLQGRG